VWVCGDHTFQQLPGLASGPLQDMRRDAELYIISQNQMCHRSQLLSHVNKMSMQSPAQVSQLGPWCKFARLAFTTNEDVSQPAPRLAATQS